jgi:hypothetical protein
MSSHCLVNHDGAMYSIFSPPSGLVKGSLLPDCCAAATIATYTTSGYQVRQCWIAHSYKWRDRLCA